ncbi:Cof-type HAD-IIB family hydrolase [Streptococcus caprae]|uniref:Cof-type HAD-IIB family hydrolase n=1 Tax=Streptococcus caprae TaxID=1640501 RepID=A0ABV8CXB5_9STRE
MIKLIATDMDGTFLDASGQFDRERFVAVLEKCREQDVLFTVASGRGILALEKLFAGFLDQIALVAENGSVVTYQGKILYERAMTREQAEAVVQHVLASPYSTGPQLLLSGEKGAYVPRSADPAYVEHMKHYHEGIRLYDDLAEIDDVIIKVTTVFKPEEVALGSAWLNERLPFVTGVTTGFEAIDIILSDVNKGEGLAHLCQELGLTAANVTAFGDNLNDLEMLEFAGSAIAMENARPELKAVADRVIGHHDDGAVLSYLEEALKND